MTNTNELTAKLKAAAPYEMKFSRLWERYDEACHGNAEHMRDILELTLDALETAERRIAKSDRDVRALTEALEAAEKRIAEQREYYESVIADGSMRIAELEARTLTVKLPHWSGYTCSGEGAMLDACVRSLESQGFTVQIEGE
ncbi:ead/Ea22-like family protein [Enterobacter kobei]|nr:ead/Ea22-like family protein [Enterobacter kobei]